MRACVGGARKKTIHQKENENLTAVVEPLAMSGVRQRLQKNWSTSQVLKVESIDLLNTTDNRWNTSTQTKL